MLLLEVQKAVKLLDVLHGCVISGDGALMEPYFPATSATLSKLAGLVGNSIGKGRGGRSEG